MRHTYKTWRSLSNIAIGIVTSSVIVIIVIVQRASYRASVPQKTTTQVSVVQLTWPREATSYYHRRIVFEHSGFIFHFPISLIRVFGGTRAIPAADDGACKVVLYDTSAHRREMLFDAQTPQHIVSTRPSLFLYLFDSQWGVPADVETIEVSWANPAAFFHFNIDVDLNNGVAMLFRKDIQGKSLLASLLPDSARELQETAKLVNNEIAISVIQRVKCDLERMPTEQLYLRFITHLGKSVVSSDELSVAEAAIFKRVCVLMENKCVACDEVRYGSNTAFVLQFESKALRYFIVDSVDNNEKLMWELMVHDSNKTLTNIEDMLKSFEPEESESGSGER